MSNKQYDDEDKKVIPDGGRVKVRLMAMDSTDNFNRPGYRQPAARDAAGINDARRAAYAEYHDRQTNAWKRDDTPITGVGTHWMRGEVGADAPYGAYPFSPERVGMSCTLNGAPGVLVEATAGGERWLVCRVTSSRTDSDGDEDVRRKKIRRNARNQEESTEEVSRDKALDQREQAYRTYDEILASSWRTGGK